MVVSQVLPNWVQQFQDRELLSERGESDNVIGAYLGVICLYYVYI